MDHTDDTALMDGPRRRRGAASAVLDLFSSVWLGIVLLVLILVYSSLGSAVPTLRQHWLIEKTEFEFFHWWPFNVLMALLVVNIVVTTVRGIRFNLLNLGVWTIHTGIVILVLGSAYYFGTKVEGDAPIFRRRAVIHLPGRAEPAHLVVRPGNHLTIGSGENEYRFEIADIQPEYVLRTEGHEGERTYAVQLSVRTPGRSFIRQLLAGYPQFTEDVIPGKGRAVKELGKPLVDEGLDVRLEYEPQTEFFVMDSAALYVRNAGEERWLERPIPGLPHFHERVSARDEVWMPEGQTWPVRPIDLEVPAPKDGADPLGDYEVRVTGYLRYAFEETRWVPGGERLNPVCGIELRIDGQKTADYELVALDPRANQAQSGRVEFRWIESLDELDALGRVVGPTLTVRVPDKDVSVTVPADQEAWSRAKDAPFLPLEGTDYAYRIRYAVNDLSINEGRFAGRTISVLVLDIKQGDRLFSRWVADAPDGTRDYLPDTHDAIDTNEEILTTYDPGSPARLTVAAGPDDVGLHAVYADGEGEVDRIPVQVGRAAPLDDRAELTVRYLYRHARRQTRPAIVPFHERRREASNLFSMIEVELSGGGWSQSRWLPFHQYALPNGQYAIGGRFGYRPEALRLPDGRRVELLFSRRRHPLPNPVVLDEFVLETFQGGLRGGNGNVRDYISMLRFGDGSGGWSRRLRMSSNRPAANDGFWFFQATWDPPSAESAGMNYTGAGVGNRNGVYIQLLGCCVAVAGMIYAFYIKPIIRRRRRQATRSSVEWRSGMRQGGPPPVEVGEAMSVRRR